VTRHSPTCFEQLGVSGLVGGEINIQSISIIFAGNISFNPPFFIFFYFGCFGFVVFFLSFSCHFTS